MTVWLRLIRWPTYVCWTSASNVPYLPVVSGGGLEETEDAFNTNLIVAHELTLNNSVINEEKGESCELLGSHKEPDSDLNEGSISESIEADIIQMVEEEINILLNMDGDP